MSEVTHHGEERARKRLGISKKNVAKEADRALEFGIPSDKFNGKIRRYLDYYYIPYRETGSRLLVYNQNMYVFKGNKLITVMIVDSHMRKYLKNHKG